MQGKKVIFDTLLTREVRSLFGVKVMSCGGADLGFFHLPESVPAGHQIRVRIELERIDQPLDEEHELERCRSALMDRGVAPSICNAIEALASARIARALRVHLDGWHDED